MGILARAIIGLRHGAPLEIGGGADPYLRRWYLIPHNRVGCGEGMQQPRPMTMAQARAEDRPPMRHATEDELRAQRESWVRGEMAIGLDQQEAADRAAWVAAGRPSPWPPK